MAMGKIYNATFLLEVSALVDIYKVYGVISEILQIVNIMPFDRKDRYDWKLGEFKEMLNSMEAEDCACSIFFDYSLGKYCDSEEEYVQLMTKEEDIKKMAEEVCCWKTLHGDLRELKAHSTYRGVVIGCLVEDGSKTRAGRRVDKASKLLDLNKVVTVVFKRASSVTTFLLRGLSEVYTSTEVTLIENIRRLLDLKSLSRTIQLHGAPNVASTKWRNFKEALLVMEPDLFTRISADELRLQYRDFVGKLCDLGRLEEENTKIFARFLDPSTGLYRWHIEYNTVLVTGF